VAERRQYTKRQRAEVVGNAEAIGIRPAARKAHVPESTVRRWRESPELAQMRAEKREVVAADVWAAFQMGVRRVMELLPITDDLQKVATAAGIIYDKYALISGGATSRSESRDLPMDFDDHEAKLMRDVLDMAKAEETANAGS
jgi:hypothetical protein